MINHTLVGLVVLITQIFSVAAWSKPDIQQRKDILIKFVPGASQNIELLSGMSGKGVKVEHIADEWIRIQAPASKLSDTTIDVLKTDPSIEFVQPNYKIHLLENYKINDPLKRSILLRILSKSEKKPAPLDNPKIPAIPTSASGEDPLLKNQWGMLDIGVSSAWKVTLGIPEMIVAIIDTGVDYTHEDLLPNLWRNPKEIPDNGLDDDNNGYVDDVIGWDFASNDNKPYDLSVSMEEILSGGGNPGHGTHCAGNVAARGGNNIGISGVAPNVKIMSLRFITEKGSGTTADAIKAIKYAVDNGAKVMSNSWGSEGEDPKENQENKALRDIIQYAQDHGVLFIAAAGNGHQGVGYDNDTDKDPGYPASYDHDNIISVAAIDSNDKLGSFSNWGAKTVDIAAPGVDIYSTMVNNRYSNYVVNLGGFEVTWDGTSMATPHVAGAAALYWSAHPNESWKEVKAAILDSAKKISAVEHKTVSGGKLDVGALLKR